MALFALPDGCEYVEIDIPGEMAIERADVPLEQLTRESFTRSIGDRWWQAGETAVLLVPSVVTLVEHNLLINPRHPEFSRIQATPPRPVYWDKRFFRRPS
jgi:RES domain-containing protein